MHEPGSTRNSPTMEQADEELIFDLLLRWEELHKRGGSVSPSELCRDRPDLELELTTRINALAATEWLEKPLDGPDPPRPDSAGPTDAPRPPRTFLERYRLEVLLAEGGFAQVWKGTDLELSRAVAIKIPKPSTLVSPEAFFAEAKRVARLKHPGIVPVFDVGRDGDTCFIVSEFIEGGSLRRFIDGGQIPWERALRWMADVAEAVHYAHVNGVIHRDIKPANILIDHHDRALIADFGIAQSPLKATKSIGTLRYMSPEQLAGEPVDATADVFSLGVVLHEALTGELPYRDSSPSAVAAKVEVGLPRAGAAGVPKGLRDICARALERDPARRHQTALAFATELRSLPARRRRGMLVVAAALTVSSIALVLGWRWFAPRIESLVRPQIRIADLPDWRLDGNDFANTLSRLKASRTTNRPTVRLFADKNESKERYEYHGGGVVAANGLVYCLPSSQGDIGVVDPVHQTVRQLKSPLPAAPGLFFGAVLAPNGHIYAIPHSAGAFLKIDPQTDRVETFGKAPENGSYWGGCVAADGLIYCVPSRASDVAVIDPKTDSVSFFGQLPGDSYKYSGGVLATNGKIYGIPDHARRVMVIDPAARTIHFIDADLGDGTAKWFGGVLGLDGKIYGGLASDGSILIIDPSEESVEKVEGLPKGRYVGGVLGPDGRIYIIPNRDGPVLSLDPATRTVSEVAGDVRGHDYWGAVLTPHGSIIAIPWNTTAFLQIDFATRIPNDWALCRLFNRY
jgi:serine/threonine protein kinase/streptogramin lyase